MRTRRIADEIGCINVANDSPAISARYPHTSLKKATQVHEGAPHCFTPIT